MWVMPDDGTLGTLYRQTADKQLASKVKQERMRLVQHQRLQFDLHLDCDPV